MTPQEVRRDLARLVQEAAPDASPEDRAIALEYVAAIPATVRRSLVKNSSGAATLPGTFPLDREQGLLQLLPTNVPPYAPGTKLHAEGTEYTLGNLLGVGGFGAVYQASMPGLQNLPLAIKFCLDPALAASLQNEKENLERLRGSWRAGDWPAGIVRLYGHCLDHVPPFLVSEYVAGGDLAVRLAASLEAGEAWSSETVLGIIRKVAEALVVAHQRGLVHRDLKPANVLVADGSQVKLADFGIGAVVAETYTEGSSRGTSSPKQMDTDRASRYRGAGTPLYMSPEQRKGQAADPRQDVYSIGVMWYQLLVGDVSCELHHGWEDELAERHHVPEEHIRIIKRCVGLLEKRPKDAGELLALMGLLGERQKAGEAAKYQPFVKRLRELSALHIGGPGLRAPVKVGCLGSLLIVGSWVLLSVALDALIVLVIALWGAKPLDGPLILGAGPTLSGAILFVIGLVISVIMPNLSRRRAWLMALAQLRRAILSEFPQFVDRGGGPDALNDPEKVLELILQFGHGKTASYLEERRRRKPDRTLVHGNHLVELVKGEWGKVRCFYEGQPQQDSFRVLEDGIPAFYEFDRRAKEVRRNGTVLPDIVPLPCAGN
jgi:hypothetical protein